MAKYRLKTVVDAVQFDPADPDMQSILEEVFLGTDEQRVYVQPGDWIITGPNGERAAHRPAIFAARFEPVEEETAAPECTTLEAVADPGFERLAAAIERLTEEVAGLRAANVHVFGGYRMPQVDPNSSGNPPSVQTAAADRPSAALRDLYRVAGSR